MEEFYMWSKEMFLLGRHFPSRLNKRGGYLKYSEVCNVQSSSRAEGLVGRVQVRQPKVHKKKQCSTLFIPISSPCMRCIYITCNSYNCLARFIKCFGKAGRL